MPAAANQDRSAPALQLCVKPLLCIIFHPAAGGMPHGQDAQDVVIMLMHAMAKLNSGFRA